MEILEWLNYLNLSLEIESFLTFSQWKRVVAFFTLRILSVSPSYGPATGNIIFSFIGSAFKDFCKLSVRPLFGGILVMLEITLINYLEQLQFL